MSYKAERQSEEGTLQCPACKVPLRRRSGQYGVFFGCPNFPKCDVAIGCHQHTGEPLGIPADQATRQCRQLAHAAFDPLWQTKKMRRADAYRWLSQELGIEKKDCHIAMFDAQTCRKVVELCQKLS